MKEERDYLVKVLKESGIRSRVHDSMKSLKIAMKHMLGQF